LSDCQSTSSDEEENTIGDEGLKDKYLDYCSAQMAEHLLLLSPDEIYLLAREAHQAEGMTGEPSYEDLVKLAQGGISKRLALPTFEEWVGDYKENSGKFQDGFLALWK